MMDLLAPPSANVLQAGIEHHRAGRLAQAVAVYASLVDADPYHADALHLLGLAAHQLGQNEQALALLTRAVNGQTNIAPSTTAKAWSWPPWDDPPRRRPRFVRRCVSTPLAPTRGPTSRTPILSRLSSRRIRSAWTACGSRPTWTTRLTSIWRRWPCAMPPATSALTPRWNARARRCRWN